MIMITMISMVMIIMGMMMTMMTIAVGIGAKLRPSGNDDAEVNMTQSSKLKVELWTLKNDLDYLSGMTKLQGSLFACFGSSCEILTENGWVSRVRLIHKRVNAVNLGFSPFIIE